MSSERIKNDCIQRLQQLSADADSTTTDATLADVRSALQSLRFGKEIADNVEKLTCRGDTDRAIRFLETAELKPKSATFVYVAVLLVAMALLTGLGILFH